ncbi:MAG: helix-turn-helix domain-containing protein, partial [Pseudomonadota bacterium]
MTEPFGMLLKEWRTRRRVSQLDLGLAANVSARHISFLETGRANPSKAMVIQLSETLDVPRAARNSLLTAAGYAQAYKARSLDDPEMAFITDAMNWMLTRHDPFPAFAFDRAWRFVRLNACATQLFGGFGINVGDSMIDALTEPGPGRDAIVNRDEVIRHLILRLRTESAHLGGDDALDAAAQRLKAELGDRVCDTPGPMPAVTPVIYSAGAARFSFFSTIAQFGSTEDIALAEMKIELMYPADEETRAFL